MYSSYAVAVVVCSAIFPTLASMAVFLRFYARRMKAMRLGADDWAITVALCLSISLCLLSLYSACRAGFGEDISLMSPVQTRHYEEHLYAAVILTHLSEGTVKLAVILLYKRIFSTAGFRLAANILILIIIGWILGATLTQVFSAWPVSSWFNVPLHYTLNYGAFVTAFAALDVALDLITLCFPLPVIWKLHLDSRRKWTLTGIFWLGILCVVAGAVRLDFAYKLSFFKSRLVPNSYSTYVSVSLTIWSEIEPCLSIIAACLPTFGPLVKSGLSIYSFASSVKSWLKRSSSSSASLEPAQLSKESRSELDDLRGGSGRWNRLDDHSSSTDGLELGKLRSDITNDNRELRKGAIKVAEP